MDFVRSLGPPTTAAADAAPAAPGDRPVGIGPVIAGWANGQPVYWVEVVDADGTTRRQTFPKRGAGADRRAKLEAICWRMRLANRLRPAGVVLIHDQMSFAGLVALLTGRFAPGTDSLVPAAAAA